jgi:TetR/AcrR family transcriptional regulator
MPTETFLNLLPEKQNRVIEAATGEFAQEGFRGACIQKIALRAGVSKGSIYQYFKNKEDLFYYLLELAAARQIEQVAESVQSGREQSLFELLELLFNSGLKLAEDNPDLYCIYQGAKQGAPPNIALHFTDKIEGLRYRFYENLLKEAAGQGVIRKNLSMDLASFVVYTLISGFSEFIAKKENLAPEKKEEYVRQCLEIIKKGIRAEKNE